MERRLIRTCTVRASNRSERLPTKRGPAFCAGHERLQFGEHLAAVADAEGERVAGEEGREGIAQAGLEEDRLRPAAAAAEHVAVGEAAAGGQRLETPEFVPGRRRGPTMWTSTASNPARSKAAAISIWPFTPCSRRMAMPRSDAGGDEWRGDVLR